MTQAQFNTEYKVIVTNWQVMTLTDRRLQYNDLMQSFYQSGQITKKQNNNWGHPKFLTSNTNKINCSAY